MESVAPPYFISIRARDWLNEETFEITCSRPQGFQFLAGQHVSLLHQGVERDYTILSPPDAGELRFLIKREAGGKLSGALANIALGNLVGMTQAKGYLTYRPTDRSVFFVATGVGVAPFVAMAASGIRDFILIHGARNESGLFYRQELAAAALRYMPCLSGNAASCINHPVCYRGHVTEYLKTDLHPGLYDFYLCGSMAMIRDVTHFLDQHHPGTRIYSEAFN